jgi:2-C-methyl-D-erythritol 4-phosphate cytidylyltransferase
MSILQWISYKYYNFKNNIIKPDIKPDINQDVNIGILLAAGTSTRFNMKTPKQLFKINDNSIISYSINSMINTVDKLVIVTNSTCYDEVTYMVNLTNNNYKITILLNDINSRIKSIKTALLYINNIKVNINKIIIHDSARPFVTKEHFVRILNSKYQYSHYYLKLVNGLVKKEKTKYEVCNRNEYIEICTPICCDYRLYYFIFMNYIGNMKPFTEEPLTILNLLNIPYEFIEAHPKYLRKITYLDDIY